MTRGRRMHTLVILGAIALAVGGCGAPPHRVASKPVHHAPSLPPIRLCTVSFSITGVNAVQALGQIHATFEEPYGTEDFTGVAPYAGSAQVTCGTPHHPTIAVLTEVPSLKAKAFLGWTLNGDGGRYESTNVATPHLRFVVTGDTSVKANFSP